MITLTNITVDFGTRILFKNVSFLIQAGDRIGLVGRNGAGKSTMMGIIARETTATGGDVSTQTGIRIGLLSQDLTLDLSKTLRETAMLAFEEVLRLQAEIEHLQHQIETRTDYESDAYMQLVQRLTDANDMYARRGGLTMHADIERVLTGLGFDPADLDKGLTAFSGGWQMRAELGRLLLSHPDCLLLDEPTNHLDADSVAWLERHLHDYEGTVIAVTHDRYFLDNVAGWILELDNGQGIPFEGNYTSWLEQKQARLALEEKQESKRQKALKEELEWVRMNPKGRHAKSKARISAYEKLLDEETVKRNEEMEIFIPPGPRLGDKVINAEGISKSFDDRLLYENLSFSLPPGGIVGIIGPNGAGKTTLFKMITDQLQPDSGTFDVGETVKIGYIDQNRPLDPKKSIWEEISDGLDVVTLGTREVNSRAYVSRFNFSGSDQQKKVTQLSGGERNRVHLAKMLKEGANVLLLDEPTNDLDVNTLRALEEALQGFAGCAVVISHDRWFLDRVATHILAFEGDSQVVWFDGNYSQYEEDRRKRLGIDADRPHRISYRKLTRD